MIANALNLIRAAAEPTGNDLEHLWAELTKRGNFKITFEGAVVDARIEHRLSILRSVMGKQHPAYNIYVGEGDTRSYFRVSYHMHDEVVQIDGSDVAAQILRIDHIEHASSLSDLVKQIAAKCCKLTKVGR